ncbi:dihydrodipicolinate synthase family protein [Microbacterium tumbae]
MSGLRLICATIVPLRVDGGLDEPGLEVLFDGLYASGIREVFTPGTTGEFTALDDAERRTVIARAVERFGAEGVYAHVGAATTAQAVRHARAAWDAGARRFAAITPYFVTAGRRSVREYYEAITREVPGGEVYAYIYRAFASTDVTPAELAELASIPGVAGAKISGRDAAAVAEYLAAVPAGFPVFSGADRDVIRAVQAGAAGIVSGVSAVFPEPFLRAIGELTAHEGDLAATQRDIDEAVALVGGGDFAMLKAGVGLRGLPAGPLRIAVDPPDDEDLDRLAVAVRAGAFGSSPPAGVRNERGGAASASAAISIPGSISGTGEEK